MCGVCPKVKSSVNTQSRPTEWPGGECTYSLEALNILLSLTDDNILIGYVKSQINNYYKNCNIYVKSIEKSLERLGISTL